MPFGIVQFYLKDKGYGYIRVLTTREEFHFTKAQLEQPVEKGDEVHFIITENKQGLFAKRVRKAVPT